MKMAKQYKSVAEMVQGMNLPAAQKKSQIEYLHARRLSRMLTVLRVQKEWTQTQAAKKLGWTQGRVSKLEKKEDRKVAVGDLLDYAEELDMQIAITFLPKKTKIVDQVKYHAGEMYKLLQRLVKLSKDDEVMAKGVSQFHDECLVNVVGMVESSRQSVKAVSKKEFTVIGPPAKELKIKGKHKECVSA
jgi:transcriptional regulator with XRE-family HTH domain